MRVSFGACLLALCACGALKPSEPAYVSKWVSGAGGPFIETCRQANALWLATPHRATLFGLQENSGPRILKSMTRVHPGQIRAEGTSRCNERELFLA